jgi:hypothetical protein
VLRGEGLGGGDASELVALLKHCRRLKDYSRLVSHLRGLAPSALDAQLRSMQVLLPPAYARCRLLCQLYRAHAPLEPLMPS